MKNQSFKFKFTLAFIKILAFSLILSLVFLFLWTLSFNKFYNPSNYYEKKIPGLIKDIESRNIYLMDSSNKAYLDGLIKDPYLGYQVVDSQGQFIYGNISYPYFKDKKDFILNVNKTISIGNKFFLRTLPIFDQEYNIVGMLVIKYYLGVSSKKLNSFNSEKIILLSPFVFITIFTLYYRQKLSRELALAIDGLLHSSRKIKNKDLDFTIDYDREDEFKEVFQAFEDMRQELEDSLGKQWTLEEYRKENLANIAHDLKTPLTIIKTYSEGIIEGYVKEDRLGNYLGTINKNSDRALAMVMDMNKLSQLENPSYSLSPLPLDPEKLVKDLFRDYQSLVEDHGFQFYSQLEDLRTSPKELSYDPLALRNILDNLVSNSLAYSKGSLLSLRAIVEDQALSLELRDNGRGFSQEDLERAFEKFYRGDRSRKNTGNSGLGMYIAQSLAKLHKGEIEIANEETGGALVKIKIRPLT